MSIFADLNCILGLQNLKIFADLPILKSKCMCAMFQKKGKIFENLCKNLCKIWKYYEKGQVIACVIIARNKLLEKALGMMWTSCFFYMYIEYEQFKN